MPIDLDHLPEFIEPIARELLGEPNRRLSSKAELRYGSNGSLSVDLRKGTFYDHEAQQGGGTLDLITRTIGLRGGEREDWLGERFPQVIVEGPRKTNGKHGGGKQPLGKEVAWYDYVDETGHALFQVVRFEPKTFRQRHREGERWVWGARGIRAVPYRLPELIEATALGHIVFVVEGEKDANNLAALGVPATCNAGGVGKWSEALNEFFNDADVVVVSDNDPQARRPDGTLLFHDDGRPKFPGQDHARSVCSHLSATAARVRLLDLAHAWPDCPKKGDISDWIAKGGTADTLYDIADHAPDWSPELPGPQAEQDLPKLAYIYLPALQGKPVPIRRWAVLNRIPASNVSLMAGDGGVGKSLLVQQLAVATVLGRDWIGAMPTPGPVMLLSAEDDEDEIHFRLDKIARQYGADFADLKDLHIVSLVGKETVLAHMGPHGMIKTTPLFDTITRDAKLIRPVWIGIDTAADAFAVEERDRSQARQCINLLRGLAFHINTAVVLLSHPSISGMASGTGLSGSTGWSNSVRSRLYLRHVKVDDDDGDENAGIADPDLRILEVMKANYTQRGEQVRLRWRDGLMVIDGPSPTARPVYAPQQNIDQQAIALFKSLLTSFNRADRPVSPNATANNGAPALFADLEDAKTLHPHKRHRKRLLKNAMERLFKAGLITVLPGPKNVAPSKRRPCLFLTPADDEKTLF